MYELCPSHQATPPPQPSPPRQPSLYSAARAVACFAVSPSFDVTSLIKTTTEAETMNNSHRYDVVVGRK